MKRTSRKIKTINCSNLPVLDHVRQNYLQIEPEQDNSIDEQIIPAKTKYSGIRQYNPKKIKNGVSKTLYTQEHQG